MVARGREGLTTGVCVSLSVRADSVFMVMEWAPHSLLDVLSSIHPLDTAHIRYIAEGLLRALAFLHEHWVLHRYVQCVGPG